MSETRKADELQGTRSATKQSDAIERKALAERMFAAAKVKKELSPEEFDKLTDVELEAWRAKAARNYQENVTNALDAINRLRGLNRQKGKPRTQPNVQSGELRQLLTVSAKNPWIIASAVAIAASTALLGAKLIPSNHENASDPTISTQNNPENSNERADLQK